MSQKRDYYEVLGVTKDATEKDLKNAFRSLARKYHPDRSTEDDAEDKFKEIQEAYAVLSDTEKRQIHTDNVSVWTDYDDNACARARVGGQKAFCPATMTIQKRLTRACLLRHIGQGCGTPGSQRGGGAASGT